MGNEDKNIIAAAKELGVDKVVPEVYHDLLQPAARELGESLATVAKAVKVCLFPLKTGVWGYEKIEEWLSVKVTSILSERNVTEPKAPPLSIAGPLITQLRFAYDEPELREMYARLLATAMDPNTTSAHPSFVQIIQQLTPDEARVLEHIFRMDKEWPSIDSSLSRPRKGTSYRRESVETGFKRWCSESKVLKIQNSNAYMVNLVRLGLFKHNVYNEATYWPSDEHSEASVDNEEYEILELTDFGRLFLDACCCKDLKKTI